MISQLTVFIENEKGHLAKICRIIADAGINMKALFLADTEDFGVARIFCNAPQTAVEVLHENGYRARVIPVLGVRVSNREGALAELLEALDEMQVNVEYGYCFPSGNDYAIDALKISDADVEKKLQDIGYILVQDEEIYETD